MTNAEVAEQIYQDFAQGWADMKLRGDAPATQVVGDLTRLLRRITNKVIDTEATPTLGN